MWGSSMLAYKKRKGIGAFVLFLIIMVFVLSTLFLFSSFDLIHKIIKIRGNVDVYMNMDDRGTEILSIMNSAVNGKKIMKLLGESAAEGSLNTDKIIQNKLDKVYYAYALSFPEGNIRYEKGFSKQSRSGQVLGECGIQTYKLSENLRWPADSKEITSGFGYRELMHRCDCHGGIDIKSESGADKVYAALSGTVVKVYNKCKEAQKPCNIDPSQTECHCNKGKGNEIVIKPDSFDKDRVYLFYFHLKTVRVKEGEHVNKGQCVGESGSTGFSTGPHLHFEVRKASKNGFGIADKDSVNPCYLFEGMSKTEIQNCIHAPPKVCMVLAPAQSLNIDRMEVPLPGAVQKHYKGYVELVR
ncbi:MAG: hypothetical protein DRP13_03560 [Candidatus Aenigmatarchaeota archaeon]|nr:MAG: hypothetical protein DRP13_03560 [Candidatus Aenigmarchaeota archaeon]